MYYFTVFSYLTKSVLDEIGLKKLFYTRLLGLKHRIDNDDSHSELIKCK